MKKALALSLWQQTILVFLAVHVFISIFASLVANCDTVSYDYEACNTELNGFIAAVIITIIFRAAYGGWRRTQIREKFGIPGGKMSDHLSWLCCPTCALCQELRTMEAYNIENGVMRVEATEPMHQPVQQSFGGAEV